MIGRSRSVERAKSSAARTLGARVTARVAPFRDVRGE